VAVVLSACAARTPPRPAGTAAPDPSAVDAFGAATAACAGYRSFEGELALSGRAGSERVRGRILTGLEPGAVRLEAVAPFGAPFFILAGRDERATLLLPREHRVLKDAGVADVLERITGLALHAEDLRQIVTGCFAGDPAQGRQWPGGWRTVAVGERTAYVRDQNGRPVLVAADYGQWHVDYAAHAGGFPRIVRLRVQDVDITARVEQLQINTRIDPRAWSVDVPSDADAMTLDELRSVAPLAEKTKQ
jgi:outer membrane biogenesis lipoprotein LolB